MSHYHERHRQFHVARVFIGYGCALRPHPVGVQRRSVGVLSRTRSGARYSQSLGPQDWAPLAVGPITWSGTLAAIVIILALLLLGIAHLARAYGVMAIDQTKEGAQGHQQKLRSEWQDCVAEPARRLTEPPRVSNWPQPAA